jgi:hypothetical protein
VPPPRRVAADVAVLSRGTPFAFCRRMGIRTIAVALIAVGSLSSSTGADEARTGKALVASGVIAAVGSTASAIACGILTAKATDFDLHHSGLGEYYGPPIPEPEPLRLGYMTACPVNLGLGLAAIPLTIVGAKMLAHGRELRYSLAGVAATF